MKLTLKIAIIGICLSSVFAAPNLVSAQQYTITDDRRNELILQINQLLEQVQLLQTLLDDQRNGATDSSNDERLYETFYFQNDFEAIYKNDDALLRRIDSSGGVRIIDMTLWNLWLDVIGESATNRYIDEFRIVDESNTRIGAFIELKPGTDEWVLGVNRSDYEQYRKVSEEIYTDIFIHEYAHIISFYDDDVREDFADEFWTTADYRHSNRLEDLSSRQRDNEMEDYFDENIDRFITDYATVSSDEDLAETFVEFVYQGTPTKSDEVYDKIRFLYKYPSLVRARSLIRNNIDL